MFKINLILMKGNNFP